MDYDSIAGKVARIRAELKQIRAENRLYFAKKHHTEDEMMQHRKRKDRVLEIRAELEAILKRKSA